ncbi:unnamed protein product [Rotaria sp. Silwood1]|nr:unnamed protein product [Rotaria sp. Silwood1]CAF4757123.1 unnamed protein product [Rotaria sp. Silwood1]
MKTCTILVLMLITFTVQGQDAVALYNEGVKLKEAKSIPLAIEKFKQAIALNPNYSDAYYQMGWCQNDTKDYSGAIISLRQARILWRSTPKVHFELGYAFENTGQTDSAIQSYHSCLFYKSNYSTALKQLGYIHYTKEAYDVALDYFGKYEAAVKDSITNYLYWFKKGFSHNALKNYTAAKVALQRSLSYKTDYINTYLELGFACFKLKEDDEAIKFYTKVIDMDSKNHIPYNGIADVYRDNKKDMDMAITWYKKTLAIKTDERKACYGMGYCLNNKDGYAEAVNYLKKAIAGEPTYTAAYVELGYANYMLSNNTEAIINLKKALELNPKSENARYYFALVYINQGDKIKAQQMVDELKNLNPKKADTLQKKVDEL